ncbi:MAG: hypothetical protein J2P36_16330 [Ktedonobacteraceae bacterium]|nr:hypothetical protein [Ktedonobacteraceae bacterium]
MPKSAQYVVSWSPEQANYVLSEPGNGACRALSEDGWLKWVGEHRAFAFHGRNGRLNLLKEKRQRGGEGYWYAYQRHEQGMVKRYVGRSGQLNRERLEEIAALLADEEEREDTISVQVSQTGKRPVPIQFEPLLMPKLQLPRLQKSLLPRERLLILLDQSLERKLTVIAGPAGYGKTTLVAQWMVQRRARTDFPRVASITLDEGDNDPVRFWRYIIAACQQFREGLGKEALELLLAHRLPPFKPLEMALIALLNELSQLEQPGVLILDDFHVISSSQVAETFSFFLDHLPASFHLIMLIRGDPPFSRTRLRARNELLDIHPGYLGFSLEETRAFFEQELPVTLALRTLRLIHERMDGWPVGLRLLARELDWSDGGQDIERKLAALAGSYWGIRDYFLTEVLHTLPEEQQEFLLQTSILPLLTVSLCDTITERTDSARLMRALRAGDLFLIPLDGMGEWARYHSLFAETMRLEARPRLGDEQLRRFAMRASDWYEEHGLLTEAIETALNAAAFARSAHLIKQLLESSQQSNSLAITELYSLKRWVERLPNEELERHPDLCVHYAMTLLFIQMEGPNLEDGEKRIRYLLQVAEQKWRDANNTAKLAEIFAFRALLARQDGRMLQAVTWARQSLAWLPEEDRTWRNLSLTVVGVGEMFDGKLENAPKLLLEALALSEQQGNRTYARATRGMLAGVSFEQGELHHAAEMMRQIQAEARIQEDYDDIAHTQLGLARIAYQWNNLEEAEWAAQKALEIGEQLQVEQFQALATVSLALIEHARDQSVQAQQRLTAWLARGQVPVSPHSYQLWREVQATLAFIQLASGNQAAVERWFASIEESESLLPLLQQRREQLLRARLLLVQGESSTAIERLEGLSRAALETGHIYLRLEIQVVLARAYARQGEHARAFEQLREVMTTTHSEGYLRLYLNEGDALADVLRELLPTLHEKELRAYGRRILGAFAVKSGALVQGTTTGTPFLLAPLSPQEQKVLRLLAAGNSNAEIACELVVSVNTVRTQIRSIYRKLNVDNRVEASAAARQLEML